MRSSRSWSGADCRGRRTRTYSPSTSSFTSRWTKQPRPSHTTPSRAHSSCRNSTGCAPWPLICAFCAGRAGRGRSWRSRNHHILHPATRSGLPQPPGFHHPLRHPPPRRPGERPATRARRDRGIRPGRSRPPVPRRRRDRRRGPAAPTSPVCSKAESDFGPTRRLSPPRPTTPSAGTRSRSTNSPAGGHSWLSSLPDARRSQLDR